MLLHKSLLLLFAAVIAATADNVSQAVIDATDASVGGAAEVGHCCF